MFNVEKLGLYLYNLNFSTCLLLKKLGLYLCNLNFSTCLLLKKNF